MTGEQAFVNSVRGRLRRFYQGKASEAETVEDIMQDLRALDTTAVVIVFDEASQVTPEMFEVERAPLLRVGGR